MKTGSAHPVGLRLSRACQLGLRHLPRRSRVFAASRNSGEKGASLLETALGMLILLPMIFGIIEISLALYTYHFISEAAREGTRYAIVRGDSCMGMNGCDASAAQIQSYLQNLGYPGIDPNAMTVNTVWSAYPAGGTCNPNANCKNRGNLVQVTVNYQYPLTIPFIPARTISMSSTSQMVISQ